MQETTSLPAHLTPEQASAYLARQHGVRIATRTLAKKRWSGGGPGFLKFGARRVLYRASDLDQWVHDILGSPRSSTAA